MKLEPEPRAKETDAAPHGTPPFSTGAGVPAAEFKCFDVPDHTMLRRIGKGSYGEVWLGRNALGTWRAVKLVRRSAFGSDRPYEREFAGIQRFEPISRSHESQLNILQVGRFEDGFYYVMELADDMGHGREIDADTYTPHDLRSEIHLHGRLPIARCLRLGLALTTALEHLHRNGLVHRDVKPSNIVFVNGIPKLADIGLVAQAEATMSFVGTEGFVPPEGPGTTQADIYSLGKVLYELSTGHDRHQFPELPTRLESPSERELLGEFNEVLLKACQRNPAERYQTSAEMHADLALLESGRSVVRLRGMERRLRLVARAGALVTALASVIALGWWWQAKQTAAVRQLAEENLVIAEERASLAESRDAAARESQRRLIEIQTGNGLRAMEADDPATAALWFAEVLQAADTDTALEGRQRDRIGNLFRRLPKPTLLFSIGAPYGTLRMTQDGGWLLEYAGQASSITGTGEVRFWSLSSGQRLRSVLVPNIWGSPFPSPSGRWAVVSGEERRALWDLTTGQPLPVEVEMAGTGGISVWSPDETLLALVSHEGTDVNLIEVPSGHRHAPLLQHSHSVIAIQFDPSGRWLATSTAVNRERRRLAPGERAGEVRVWDVGSGAPVTDALELGDNSSDGLLFSPDGAALALFSSFTISLETGLEGAHVRVIDLPRGSDRFAALQHADTVVGVAFSPDGRYLATGSADKTVSLWHAHSGEPLYPPLKHEHIRVVLRFSPDGAWLAAAGEAGVRIWDVRSGALALPDLRHEERVDLLEFTPDGRRLLTQTRSGLVRSYDLTSMDRESATMFLDEDGTPVTSVSFSPDGRRSVAVGPTGELRLWDATSGQPMGSSLVPKPETEVTLGLAGNAASWSPDGRLLVVPSGDGTAWIWEVDAGKESPLRLRHPPFVGWAEFSPDGSRLVTAGSDGTARIWDAETGLERVPPLRHQDRVIRARFSPDARRVATASWDRTARVWDAETGEPVSPSIAHEGQVTWVEFSPNGSCVVLAGNHRWVTIRDSVSGAQIGSTIQHQAAVMNARFSADGRRILTASIDRTARVWDAETGAPITPPLRHQGVVVGGGFSPDGLRVVTGSADGTARLWDAATGEPLGPALRHAQGLLFAGFSPDGQRVVTTSVDGTARMWEVAPLDWSVAELMAGARLLAAGIFGSAEEVEPMAPLELEATWQTIGDRFQADEGAGNTASLVWHRQRLNSAEQAQQWFAAEFHARQLAALAPGDPIGLADLERVLSRRPPPRDPAAPSELIDLSAFYNASLAIPWHGPQGNHLAELPRGIQTLGGTRFDVRGLIQVINRPHQGSLLYPSQVTGIRIGLKARRLQFLHATMGGQPPDGTRVGHYRVRYANGRTEELPVIYGRHARTWHEDPGAPVEADAATIAWTGTNPATTIAGTRGIRLFKWTWENPAPDLELVSLDLVAEDTAAHPFLVALTAD